jgi:hypothetical protein
MEALEARRLRSGPLQCGVSRIRQGTFYTIGFKKVSVAHSKRRFERNALVPRICPHLGTSGDICTQLQDLTVCTSQHIRLAQAEFDGSHKFQ